jgi:predicted TIM-barrel enzyme
MRQLIFSLFVVFLVVNQSCSFFGSGKRVRVLAEIKAREDSSRVADSLKRIHDVIVENARLDSVRKADEMRIARESRYNIIVGSFINSENAKLLAEKYNGMGYNTSIIKPEGSKFELVSAERMGNFKIAAERLEAFRDTVQIEAWVYIKE